MRVSALEGHRVWAASYNTSPNPLLALESRLLTELLGRVASQRVIDVACGTGRWAARLAASGAVVYGIDMCREMLEQAPKMLDGRVILADVARLPIAAEAADLTICSLAAAYFPDLDHAFFEMARVTKSGGRVLVSDLHPEAVAAGWTRSFRAGSLIYEMEHFGYSLERIHGAGRDSGLALESECHARFGQPERTIFEAAGKADSLAEAANIKALWIGSWRKP